MFQRKEPERAPYDLHSILVQEEKKNEEREKEREKEKRRGRNFWDEEKS